MTSLYPHCSLEGKVAIITGSTQGLGEATARLFKERGIRGLILTGRNAERGRQLVESLTDDTCSAHFVQADLSKMEDVEKITKAADEHFGTLHILVNAAACTGRGSIWDTTPELLDKMMAVNLKAPFFLMQQSIKIMEREKAHGSIVNISSTASYGSLPMLAPYSISKGALNVATKNIAYAVMRSHIRVNALGIGWMDTPGEDAVQREVHGGSDDWLQQAEAQQPFGRLLKVGEVARCIAYCASDESGMMTGCLIDFDQSVFGGGPAPVPPPKEEWSKVDNVRYSFQEDE
jgi:NAD(P)-dependent dehydrogenase (short-subunit alcohol dehydrogenase family)